ITASVTSSCRYSSASCLSFWRMRAETSGAVSFLSPSSVVQSLPMWRLTDDTVFLVLVTAWRLAISPTSESPFLLPATTDGVVRRGVGGERRRAGSCDCRARLRGHGGHLLRVLRPRSSWYRGRFRLHVPCVLSLH